MVPARDRAVTVVAARDSGHYLGNAPFHSVYGSPGILTNDPSRAPPVPFLWNTPPQSWISSDGGSDAVLGRRQPLTLADLVQVMS
jgi:hypothetical protein